MNKIKYIKAEIERLKNELIQEVEKGYKSDFDEGRISAFEDMIIYINSLPDTEKDFGIKNVGTVWHDANNVPTKKELCLIVYDCDNGPSLSNTEVVIANPLTRRFVTCSYPHNTGKQYTVQGETPIQVDVYHSCRDYIPFSDVDKWAYISDLFNLNNSQEDTVSNDLQEACDEYYNETWDEHGGKAMVVDGCHDIWFPSQATDDFFEAGAQWRKEQLMANAVEAVIHPYDGEIWVDKDLLSIYNDCQRVKLIIIEEE